MLTAELAPWRQENHKLRDTNELLKTDLDFSHRNQAQSLRYDPNRGCGRNTPRFRPHPLVVLNHQLSVLEQELLGQTICALKGLPFYLENRATIETVKNTHDADRKTVATVFPLAIT